MKVFVTGGSGFLGINLIRYLKKRKHKIVNYDIADFNYPDKGIETVKGDIRNLSLLEKAMKGCDIVVHCAAALPLYSNKDILTTDVDGTRNVLEAAKRNKIKRVVFISSTAVYGIPDHHPLYENDKLEGVGEYGKSKILAEKVCQEYRKKGMIVPILRPKSFIGPERLGVFSIYYEWILQKRSIPIIGNGRNRYQLLDVEDLCEATYLCMKKRADIVNDTFNIGAKEFTTMREDFGYVLKLAGYGKKIVPTPAKPIIWILRTFEALNISPLYRWIYETAPEDSFVSVEKAERKLNFTPKYSNKDALQRNFDWYKKHRNEYVNKSGVSHRVPWKQGILSFVGLFFKYF